MNDLNFVQNNMLFVPLKVEATLICNYRVKHKFGVDGTDYTK